VPPRKSFPKSGKRISKVLSWRQKVDNVRIFTVRINKQKSRGEKFAENVGRAKK
jgi:hypothetical protein